MIKKKNENVESCKCTEECHCKGGCCCCKALKTLVSIATLVFAILAFVFAYRTYKVNILPMGGFDNFKKMETIYTSDKYVEETTSSIEQSIEQFNAQIGADTTNNEIVENDTNAEENSNNENYGESGTLKAEDVAALKVNGTTYGPENARITILEFADASCGYCKRQVAQDKTVDNVMNQFPGDVNVIFKNFPIFNPVAAQAMACAEDQLSPENYHEYVIAVFGSDSADNVDSLAELAATYGADATTLANCVNNGDKAAEVDATMEEGSKFGISGTPSSVIINNESGEFRLVPGAYPAETFVDYINELLA